MAEKMSNGMLRMTITRKEKANVVLWFENTEQIKVFNAFIEELIENVKKRKVI
jgi:hypothetical protein